MEKGIQGVIFLCGKWVKFMIMTDGTTGCHPHPNLYGSCGAVDSVAVYPFGGNAASFTGADIAAVESRGNFLVHCCLGY